MPRLLALVSRKPESAASGFTLDMSRPSSDAGLPQDIADRLKPAFHDPNNRVRGNAAITLARKFPDKVLQFAQEACSSEDKWGRCTASFTLGRLPPGAWNPLLEPLLTDPDADVRANALGSYLLQARTEA